MLFFRILLGLTFVVFAIHADPYNNSEPSFGKPFFSTTAVNCSTLDLVEFENLTQISSSPSEDICITSDCINRAKTILEWMDSSVNPCDDFYKFTCGNYMKSKQVPDSKLMLENLNLLKDKINLEIKKNIENDIDESDPKVFKQMQTFYNVCMDTDEINKNGETNLRAILKELGGWPVLQGDSWDESAFDWKKTIFGLNIRGFDINYLFDLKINRNKKFKNQTELTIGKTQFILDAANALLDHYKVFVFNMAELLGVNITEYRKEFDDMLIFESHLANITYISREEFKTMHELQDKYPNISWTEFVTEILSFHVGKENFKLSDLIHSINVSLDLKSFFQLISETPKRVLANYLMWRAVMETSSYISKRGQNLTENFLISAGMDKVAIELERKPRWLECIGVIEQKLPLALGALYVRRNFNDDSKQKVITITKNMKKSLINLLIKVNWLDKETKKAALDKLENMSERVAYPSEFMDNKIMNKYHQSLKLYPKNFLKSFLSLKSFRVRHDVEILLKSSGKYDWTFHQYSIEANAFHNPLINSIEISTAILQDVFFTKDGPQYLNYGSIGYTIAHEMAHAFDNERRVYDKEGNLMDWWQTESKNEFEKRSQCLINQYNDLEVADGLKINGRTTLNENIADNIGIKGSYYAYLAWEKENMVEPRLPGLNYTSRQMFWISSANVWCAKVKNESLKYWIENRSHTLHKQRVIGMLSNMREFARDFSCPPNSKMNPPKKFGIFRK